MQAIHDVDYLGADRAEKLDLYLPSPATRPRPAMLVIHGGGFFSQDKRGRREIEMCEILAGAGYVCASINYILASRELSLATFPRNLQDVKTAARFLRVHAARYGVDPERIGAIGGSAGGTLSLLAGLTRPADGLDPAVPWGNVSCAIQAVVNLYGPTVWAGWRPAPPDVARQVSAVTYARPDAPPVLTLHGTADALVPLSHAEQLDAALRQAGAHHELIVVPGAPHSFGLGYTGQDLRTPVIAFLDRRLKGTP